MSTPFNLTLNQSAVSAGDTTTNGTIRIGDFSERFEVDLSYWAAEQYRASWRAAASLLVSGGDKAAFITSISDPATANIIFWWTAHRDGERVYLQQQVLFLEQLQTAFDPSAPFIHIGPREQVDEDGNKISEWAVSVDDMRAFLDAV